MQPLVSGGCISFFTERSALDIYTSQSADLDAMQQQRDLLLQQMNGSLKDRATLQAIRSQLSSLDTQIQKTKASLYQAENSNTLSGVAQKIKTAMESQDGYAPKKVSGDNTLETYDDSQYNNVDADNLRLQYNKDVEAGWISPLSGFENYKILHDRIQTELVGKTTANGIEITGQTAHFIQRVIGTMEDPKIKKEQGITVHRSGVTIEDIQETLLNGYVRPPVVDPTTGKRSQRIIGENCELSINPDTGMLIQCNPN